MHPKCKICSEAHNGLNGRYCLRLKRYVEHSAAPPCGQKSDQTTMNNQQLTTTPTAEAAIVRSENVAMIMQAAPDAYRRNVTSVEACTKACEDLIEKIEINGMTPELDKQAAEFIARSRKTVAVMNQRRSPVTQLFDRVRFEFTALENAVDPTRQDTAPYRLQQLRNAYAKQLHEEAERRRQEAEAARQKEQAKINFRAECAENLRIAFNRLVEMNINLLTEEVRKLTLDNYDQLMDHLVNLSVALPDESEFHTPSSLPLTLSLDEAEKIYREVSDELRPKFAEQFRFEVGDCRDDLIAKLPSKRAELERAARASAEEAERIRQEIRQREAAEAARLETERRAKEQADKERAAAEKAKAEMANLFSNAAAETVKTKIKVAKKIRVNNPQAFLGIISTWWQLEGCTLSIEELSKIFKKQLTFCEKLVNKDGATIEAVGIEYVDDVKAK